MDVNPTAIVRRVAAEDTIGDPRGGIGISIIQSTAIIGGVIAQERATGNAGRTIKITVVDAGTGICFVIDEITIGNLGG